MKTFNATPNIYFIIFFASALASALMIPFLRKIAFKYSILDIPDQPHKTHIEKIPYLGGWSIVFPIILIILIGPNIFLRDSVYPIEAILITIPAIFLAIVGLYDDIKKLTPSLRFYIQTVTSAAISLYLNELGYGVKISEHTQINLLLSIFWIVGITNAFNLLDNLDGGAIGITLVCTTSLFVLSILGDQQLIALMSLAFAGSSLGFLYWNKFPAKIYLGDSGALFIGFFIATLSLQFEPTIESRITSSLIPVFMLAVPIIDTTVAVVGRFVRGKSIFEGGQDHLSHRLIRLGLNKKATAYFLWCLTAFFCFMSITLLLIPLHYINIATYLILFLMILTTIVFLIPELWF